MTPESKLEAASAMFGTLESKSPMSSAPAPAGIAPAAGPQTMDSEKLAKVRALANDPEVLVKAYGSEVGTLSAVLENKYVLACSLFASLAGFEFGIDQGIMSVTLVMPQFLQQFPLVDGDRTAQAGLFKGIVTALLELGAVIGAIAAGFIADRLGRKGGLRLGLVFFVLGAILQTTSYQYAQLVVGRFVGGLGIGALSMTAPVYISEISSPNVRGVLLASEEFSIVFGICVAFYVTFGARYIDSDWSWRLAFLLQIVPAAVMFGLSTFLPESPRWLASKPGRQDEALKTLAKIRQRDMSDELVQAEFLDIRTGVEMHEEIRRERHPEHLDGSAKSNFMLEIWEWLDCFRSGCAKRTILGIVLMLFQQLVGINSLIYYAPTITGLLNLDYNLQLQMSGVINVAQLVGVIASFFVIDRLGRRPLLLLGSFGMLCTLVIVSVLVAKFNGQWDEHRPEAWAGIAMLILYMVIFGISWGPIPWAMPAEIFPQSLRSKGVAYSTVSNWTWNFVVGLITPVLVQRTGYGAFAFFAVWCFLSMIWVWFCVPEVKGVPLEDMDRVFGDRTGQAEKERYQRIEQRLAAEAHGRLKVSSANQVVSSSDADSAKDKV